MSWFAGKRFRRVRCENVDEILSTKNASDQVRRLLIDTPPILSFLRLDEATFRFTVEMVDRHRSFIFKTGQEHEIERLDGSKIKFVYYLEGDNVMKQTVILPDGKRAYFTREFSETEAKMIVYLDGTDLTATIFYEVVQ